MGVLRPMGPLSSDLTFALVRGVVDRPGDRISDPERAGVLRYFVRDAGKIVWADRPEELIQYLPPRNAALFRSGSTRAAVSNRVNSRLNVR
jgi:hypothetical protein